MNAFSGAPRAVWEPAANDPSDLLGTPTIPKIWPDEPATDEECALQAWIDIAIAEQERAEKAEQESFHNAHEWLHAEIGWAQEKRRRERAERAVVELNRRLRAVRELMVNHDKLYDAPEGK